MKECTCSHVQEMYEDGSWSRSFRVDLDDRCPLHVSEFRGADTQKALEDAVRRVWEESATPEHILKARQRGILGWPP